MKLSNKIKVDIISDVMCPWCLVGYKRFEQALKELDVEDKFELTWHPFELNPDMSQEGEEVLSHLSKKYNMSIEDAKAAVNNLKEAFKELDFIYNDEERKMLNTLNAHILLDFAKNTGKQTALKEALFKAYFTENKDVSKKDVLEEIIKNVGLDTNKAMEKLENSESKEDLKAKEKFWLQRGINSVPTMIFNESSMLKGAYPIESYKKIISDLLNINKSEI